MGIRRDNDRREGEIDSVEAARLLDWDPHTVRTRDDLLKPRKYARGSRTGRYYRRSVIEAVIAARTHAAAAMAAIGQCA